MLKDNIQNTSAHMENFVWANPNNFVFIIRESKVNFIVKFVLGSVQQSIASKTLKNIVTLSHKK